MPHDKIKVATRIRVAQTGEPYSVAHRAVINAHRDAQAGSHVTALVPAAHVASPIGHALGVNVGQAFEPLDQAICSQIAEAGKIASDMAANRMISLRLI